ncbi:MAG: flagellar motor switch protein FliN [Desulfobacterales bacterium]|jgi:flagellar motor switch protein FliN
MSNIEKVDIQTSIVDAITEIFSTMLSMDVVFSDSGSPGDSGASRVLGTVNFAGNVAGALDFDVTNDFARVMAAQRLGIKPEEIEDQNELVKVITEISRVIGDKLKLALTDAGQSCLTSAPTIIFGTDFTITPLDIMENETFVFKHQQDTFLVSVRLKNHQSTAGASVSGAVTSSELSNKIDAEKLNALDLEVKFSQSVVTVFDTMFSMTLDPVESVPATNSETVRSVVSTSFIGDITGMVNIHAMDPLPHEMTANLLGVESTKIQGEKEINDMFGELGNIVASNIKSTLTDAGFNSALAIPFLITGSDFTVDPLTMGKFDRFDFRCGEHLVCAEIGVKTSEPLQGAATRVNDDHIGDDQNKTGEKPVDEEHGGMDPSETVETNVSKPQSPKSGLDDPSSPADAKESQAKKGPAAQEDLDLDLLLDIPLEIKVELGRAKIKIHKLLNLVPGSAVKLTKLDGEPVDILANDTLIARGEVVVQREKYGIRVTEITSRMDRIRSFRG